MPNDDGGHWEEYDGSPRLRESGTQSVMIPITQE
jgi:hypothetical protein